MKVILALNGISDCGEVEKAVVVRPWPIASSFCLLNVLDPYPFVRVPLLLDRAKNRVRENLESTAARLHVLGENVTVEIVVGSPRRGINAFARDWEADLVMVGSNELQDWERLLLGSTARSVVRHAPCSVEIVRPARAHANDELKRAMKILIGDGRVGIFKGSACFGGRSTLARGQRGGDYQRPGISSAKRILLPQCEGSGRFG